MKSDFINITERESYYQNLEMKSVHEILLNMNKEDESVPRSVSKVLKDLVNFIEEAVLRMKNEGKLYYIGAGTSGRLGVLDASECPPTFGVSNQLVNGLIAGGDSALRYAVEFSEDNKSQGWRDLLEHGITKKDVLVGIAASGKTPYVLGALESAKQLGILTASISCNQNAPISEVADFPIEIITGPEFVTGSTRLKAGTAQKLVLNMISTSIMIKLGRVKGIRMIDMQLTNDKLINRGVEMLVQELEITAEVAKNLLEKHKSVRMAIKKFKTV